MKLIKKYSLIPENVVRYNRYLRMYTPQDKEGTVITLQSPNKLTALLNLLHYDCSPVAQGILKLITKHSEYFNYTPNKKRLVKAGFILRDGLLTNIPATPNFYCRSQSDYEAGYTLISEKDDTLSCSCVDYKRNYSTDKTSLDRSEVNLGGEVCKHILAVIINDMI